MQCKYRIKPDAKDELRTLLIQIVLWISGIIGIFVIGFLSHYFGLNIVYVSEFKTNEMTFVDWSFFYFLNGIISGIIGGILIAMLGVIFVPIFTKIHNMIEVCPDYIEKQKQKEN